MTLRAASSNVLLFFAIAVGIGFTNTAHAGPADNIYTPIIDYHEWELELKGGVQDWSNRERGENAYKVAFGYGIAPRWSSEVSLEYTRTPGTDARVEEIEWENIIQLTEHGEHWLDAGIFTELAYNRLAHRSALSIGPMFQNETGRAQTNFNLLWTRQLGTMPDRGGMRNEISYAAQWKWNLRPAFQPGVQAFGSLGDPAHLHSQALRAGPAFFGVAHLGNGRNLKYNAALLGGLTRETPNATLRLQLEYEFF